MHKRQDTVNKIFISFVPISFKKIKFKKKPSILQLKNKKSKHIKIKIVCQKISILRMGKLFFRLFIKKALKTN
jgi:hypothetical protein